MEYLFKRPASDNVPFNFLGCGWSWASTNGRISVLDALEAEQGGEQKEPT